MIYEKAQGVQMDQATTLRKLSEERMENKQLLTKKSGPRVISITSGKGGVGKTNIMVNMGYYFSKLGYRVLIVDADLGLANVDILLNVNSKYNLQHLFSGEMEIEEILVDCPHGIKLLPASSGITELTHLTDEHKMILLTALDQLEEKFDILLVDTGAGISSNVLYFNSAARENIVVATPEPTSIADAYATMKELNRKCDTKEFLLLVNNVDNANLAKVVYKRLTDTSDRFLNISIDYLGYIYSDKNLPRAVRSRGLILNLFPESPASKCIINVGEKLLKDYKPTGSAGSMQFFFKKLLEERKET